jgi:acid phosphatase
MTGRRVHTLTALVGALVVLAAAACGSAKTATRTKATTPSTTTTTPAPTTTPVPGTGRHVMVVMMENKSASEVIGQSSQPYTNNLASTYGVATRSYAFGHPSLPNYLDLVSGSNQGVTDDGPPSSHSFPGAQTLADQLAGAGFTAKAYAENLPADHGASVGGYAVRHVPWEYFPRTKITVTDASSLLPDLSSAKFPDFVWYTPNLINDEHDGTVQQGDAFLSRFIPQVQATAWYRSGGVIIVEWDESDGDSAGINGSGGGHVATIVVSNALKAHPQQDSAPVDSAGILRSVEDAFGLAHLNGAADPANGNINSLLLLAP